MSLLNNTLSATLLTIGSLNVGHALCQDRGGGTVIDGYVKYDTNGNGTWDHNGDAPAVNMGVRMAPGTNVVFTNEDGYYWFVDQVLESHMVQLSPYSSPPFCTGIVPEQYEFEVYSGAELDTAKFLLIPDPLWVDASVQLNLSGPARPGMSRMVTLTILNSGMAPASGVARFTKDPAWEWGASPQAPATQTITTTSWPYTNLPGNAPLSFSVQVDLPGSVPIGTLLSDEATVVPSGSDLMTSNNSSTWLSTVVNSSDPNDKVAIPSELSPDEAAQGATVEYMIRFQNTGTAPALDVLITDTLDERLLHGPMMKETSSHPCTWWIANGVAHFSFENINLPDSLSDPVASQGFVTFRSVLSPELAEGDSIANLANIFFDFNAPVITAPAWVVVGAASGIARAEMSELQVEPTLALDHITIHMPTDGTTPSTLRVVDNSGRLIYSEKVNTRTTLQLDARSWGTGTFTIILDATNGTSARARVCVME